jgi:5-hydroxyisourate hydrolase
MTTLSTHVLDAAAGRPAESVRVELFRAGELVAAAETDCDGRIAALAEVPPGVYTLAFQPNSPFFRRVELEVDLAEGHHHVPLLVSPYSCTTYRGS